MQNANSHYFLTFITLFLTQVIRDTAPQQEKVQNKTTASKRKVSVQSNPKSAKKSKPAEGSKLRRIPPRFQARLLLLQITKATAKAAAKKVANNTTTFSSFELTDHVEDGGEFDLLTKSNVSTKNAVPVKLNHPKVVFTPMLGSKPGNKRVPITDISK